MKAHLLVIAAGLCLTAALATPVSAASTTTTKSQTAKAEEPEVACNLKGCWEIHKKTSPQTETKKPPASSSSQNSGATPHP